MPVENHELILLSKSNPDPDAWTRRYLTAPSILREEEDNNRGKNPSILISNPSQTLNQFMEDRVIRVPRSVRVTSKNVVG